MVARTPMRIRRGDVLAQVSRLMDEIGQLSDQYYDLTVARQELDAVALDNLKAATLQDAAEALLWLELVARKEES